MERLIARQATVVAPGAVHLPGWLDHRQQQRLVDACLRWADDGAGFRAPRMPSGSSMSVGIVCLGWHWFPYRYSRTIEDGDGRPVGAFPLRLGHTARRAVADAAAIEPAVAGDLDGSSERYQPDVALINRYQRGARMGMHADKDEPKPAPVVSLSLGDSGLFRFGTTDRRGSHVDVVLESGDAFVFGGPARRCYHGVPKVLAGTGDPLLGIEGIRLNVTVRESGLS